MIIIALDLSMAGLLAFGLTGLIGMRPDSVFARAGSAWDVPAASHPSLERQADQLVLQVVLPRGSGTREKGEDAELRATPAGPTRQTALKNLYFLPERNVLAFSVVPGLPRPDGAYLVVYPLQDDRPVCKLPVKAMPTVQEPVVVQIGRDTGSRTISRTATVSPQGQRVEKLTLYEVDVDAVPAGRYRLKLEGGPPGDATSYSIFEIPERQALLSVDFPAARPADLKVGDHFDVRISLENTGPASARDLEVTLTLRNQQLHSVDPKLPFRRQGDRVVLTVPEIPARGKFPLTVRYRAAAAEEKLRLNLKINKTILVHPGQRTKEIVLAIGKVSPR